MKAFKQYLKERWFTEKTIASYVNGMEKINSIIDMQGVELDEMKYADILEYVKRRKTMGVSVRTINTDLKILRHYFNHLIHRGFLSKNPANNVQVRGARKNTLYGIIRQEGLQGLYDFYSTKGAVNTRNKIIVGLLVFQGITTGELAKIRLSHVDLENCNVTIPESKKSNRRTLPLQSKQLLPLLKYLESEREKINKEKSINSPLLVISTGEGDKIKNLLDGILNKLRNEFPSMQSWNQLRTSVICSRLRSDNLRQQQHYFGFRFVSSIEKYLQNNVDDIKEELDRCFVL